MEIQLAVAKTNKFGSTESGDTLEMVERPAGGLSCVLADGGSSTHDARLISSFVVHKVMSLLSDGVRDGAAVRAASDQLFTEHNGKASAYLNVISADLETNTIVLTRNNPVSVFIARGERIECLSGESSAIGYEKGIRPSITEIPLEADTTIVMYTDGVFHAGEKLGVDLDICTMLESLLEDQDPTSQQIADTLLAEAVRLDQGSPRDDMSVVVMRVLSRHRDTIRRMSASIPVLIKKTEL